MFCSRRCIRGYSGLNVWPSFRYSASSVLSSSLSLTTNGFPRTTGRESTSWLSASWTRLSFWMRSARALRSESERTATCWVIRSWRSPTLSPVTKRMSLAFRKSLCLASAASSFCPGLLHLLGEELGRAARRLDLLLERLGDEGLGERVRHAGGQVRVEALEGHPDQPGVADRLDREPGGEAARERRLEGEVLAGLGRGRGRDGDPPDQLLAHPALRAREPALLRVDLLELRVLVEREEPDDPAREGPALEDLQLGRVLRVLVVVLLARDDLFELEDPRRLLVDPEGRGGREHRARREGPDGGHDQGQQEEGDHRPAVTDEDAPVVPEVRLLRWKRLGPDGWRGGGERAVARELRREGAARAAGR